MNFGFRYHVASLMAVFFSLILGILIGGALVPEHVLVDEQAILIGELEERFRETHAQISKIKGELDDSNSAWEQLLKSLSADLLATKTLVLVNMPNTKFDVLRNTLKMIGARVVETNLDALQEKNWSSSSSDQDLALVFPLFQESYSEQHLNLMSDLVAEGCQLSFVWDRNIQPVLKYLPTALLIDGIDTFWGQLALIFGLNQKIVGHYGSQKGAISLFP